MALLADEGYLTDLRTAVAGFIAAKYLAVKHPIVGIIGTGTQARLQLQMLQDYQDVYVWGRSAENVKSFIAEFPFVKVVASPQDIAAKCNLIITTTPATQPVLKAEWIRPGTHITAVGTDAPGKCELDLCEGGYLCGGFKAAVC